MECSDPKQRKALSAPGLLATVRASFDKSDSRVREIIDPIDPKALRPAFKKIFASLQRGKALEAYQFYKGAILVSIDGT